MIFFDGYHPDCIHCYFWENWADRTIDSAFYGAVGIAVACWLLVRSIKRRRRAEEEAS